MTTATHALRSRRALVVVLCVLFLSAGSAPVFADTPSSGGDITVAQTLGDRELTVVLRRVTSVPGPLGVDIITHAGTTPGVLSMTLTPTGTTTGSATLPAPGVPTARSAVELGTIPGTYSATMPVDRPGPWELAIGDGQRTARLPFVVPVQTVTPPERLVYGGFLGAGVLLLVSVVVAVRARRSGWALLPAGGTLVGLSVAITGAVLSASLPLPPQPGNQLDPSVDNVTNPYALSQPLTSDYSRPPVTLTLEGTPLTAGRAADVGLDLTDGATGAPADDLLVHDSALIHLLVIGPTGRLWHEHPIRIAPGRYQQHLLLPVAGHYALSAELVRRGGGVQLVRAAAGLDVAPARTAGSPGAVPDPVHVGAGGSNTGMAVVGGVRVTVTTTNAVAGMPTTVTARVGDAADLQPWLGMVGHLIIAGPLKPGDVVGTAVQSASVWAHVHSMGGSSVSDNSMGGMSMPGNGMGAMVGMAPVNGDSAPDETVAAYGPDVPFTFTFPVAGEYRLWIQVEREYTVLTVPVVLDVAVASSQGVRR
jgi:hypothetical protein